MMNVEFFSLTMILAIDTLRLLPAERAKIAVLIAGIANENNQ